MNLPSERLVLGFGVGLAAVAYAVRAAEPVASGGGVSGDASLRALVVLGAAGLLALVLRVARWLQERDGYR